MSAPTASAPTNRRALLAWCVYDWANSAIPTLIVTFVFAAYFTQAVAPDQDTSPLEIVSARLQASIETNPSTRDHGLRNRGIGQREKPIGPATKLKPSVRGDW